MKKLAFLVLTIVILCFSCKKTEYVQFRFAFTGNLPYDSIDYSIVNYSEISELKPEETNNPEVYSHSVTMDLKKDYLSLVKGNIYVFKKIDLIGKSGKIMYYVPYENQPGSDKIMLKLPQKINVFGNMNLAIDVVRYYGTN